MTPSQLVVRDIFFLMRYPCAVFSVEEIPMGFDATGIHRNNQPELPPSWSPSHVLRLGQIMATVWAAPSSDGVRYSVTFFRFDPEDDGSTDSYSFSRDELPQLAEIVRDAWRWIYANAPA